MKVLLIFNREPYDNTDVTFNGLRLAKQLKEDECEVRVFLMNDAVDLAREVNIKNPDYDQDLSLLLKALIIDGVDVKACGSCETRCGIYKNQPYFDGIEKSTIQALSHWVTDSDRVINL
ncbi:MAG: uncharacterized protein involved in oxidation of intracellular sulfur [Thiomicrorhabdus sp.]|nr:MAG: uncharacterized protein involved in oxidation of intracellular sulfur [Thiomicrorhabdus sp.]